MNLLMDIFFHDEINRFFQYPTYRRNGTIFSSLTILDDVQICLDSVFCISDEKLSFSVWNDCMDVRWMFFLIMVFSASKLKVKSDDDA